MTGNFPAGRLQAGPGHRGQQGGHGPRGPVPGRVPPDTLPRDLRQDGAKRRGGLHNHLTTDL